MVYNHCTPADRVAYQQQGCEFTILILRHTYPGIKQLNKWIADPLMEWEATDKQEEEIGVIHEVMDKSLRHQHEVMSSSVQIQ